jgi:hypothetical protein
MLPRLGRTVMPGAAGIGTLPQRFFSAAAKTVRIGGASGFWGDTAVAAPQLLRGGNLDYLVFDYLAETTMAILAKMHERDSSMGYARDFVSVTMKDIAKTCKSSGVKVIANAGGVNPLACKAALEEELDKQGVDLKVGVVLGDDLGTRADELRTSLGTVDRFDGMGVLPPRPLSMNAYLGARPIATLLGQGCDVVITGRTVDSAVTLGACMHEFGWNDDEYDALSGATLAGHIIECGAQATGGLFTDWELAADGWFNIGYPIATVEASGAFTITKPPETGGVLSVGAVSEQLLYEIGDPGAYHVPDVACDWTQVQIEQPEPDAVRVSNAKGQAPTDTYKVTTTYFDGFRSEMALVVQGIDADRKAYATANALFRRQRLMLEAMGLDDYSETNVEVLGAEHTYGANRVVAKPREVVLKMAARHPEKRALELFGREIASAATSMAPGTLPLLATGRPSPAPLVRVFNSVVPKSQVPVAIAAGKGATDTEPVAVATDGGFVASASRDVVAVTPAPCQGATKRVPLVRLCYGRSGDKGNTVNIGLVARQPEYLPFLRATLTESAVGDYFAHAIDGESGRVTRYDLPGLSAMNFVMTSALGGGGTSSIRVDALAKGFAQQLLSMEVEAPVEWFDGE